MRVKDVDGYEFHLQRENGATVLDVTDAWGLSQGRVDQVVFSGVTSGEQDLDPDVLLEKAFLGLQERTCRGRTHGIQWIKRERVAYIGPYGLRGGVDYTYDPDSLELGVLFQSIMLKRGLVNSAMKWVLFKAVPYSAKASTAIVPFIQRNNLVERTGDLGASLLSSFWKGAKTKTASDLGLAAMSSMYQRNLEYLLEQLRARNLIRSAASGGAAQMAGDQAQQLVESVGRGLGTFDDDQQFLRAASAGIASGANSAASTGATNAISILEDNGLVLTFDAAPDPWIIQSGKTYVYMVDGVIRFKTKGSGKKGVEVGDEELGVWCSSIKGALLATGLDRRTLTAGEREALFEVMRSKGYPPLSVSTGVWNGFRNWFVCRFISKMFF